MYFATHDLFFNNCIINIHTTYVTFMLQVDTYDKNATLGTTLRDMEQQTPFNQFIECKISPLKLYIYHHTQAYTYVAI